MADIITELGTIQSNFEELITMFDEGSGDNQEYQKLTKTIDTKLNGGQINYYLGNINDTLIEQNPDAKQIITLLIPKDDKTIIQGVLHKK